jgi:inner membrane transporter RhtA
MTPRPEEQRSRLGAVGLVLGGVVSVQIGAAVAFTLFDDLGPSGAVLLRVGLAALILAAVWRPAIRGLTAMQLRDVAMFGAVLAAMNLSFYESLDRIPLGIAVTLEFVGPLGVAVIGSRRRIDLLWVALAAAGIVLLAPASGGDIDTLGVLLALLAGTFWAGYIVMAARIGRSFDGQGGLALAMVVGTVLLIPVGFGGAIDAFGELELLAAGLGAALLSSAIPYSLELEALRTLPESTFGVLMSLEPAVAATVGFVGLDQDLAATDIVAIALVVVASAGALRTAPPPAEA